jgi:DNA-binding transcriptional ArsR family regulator
MAYLAGQRVKAQVRRLRQGPLSASELAEGFAVSKPTMSAHFAVLMVRI